MKRFSIGLIAVAVIAVVTVAYAHGPGWGGGQMMGPGYGYGGGQMMGSGPMRGWGGYDEPDRKFLDDTSTLRRELHNKRFEYSEALRNPETKSETVTKLEKEMWELQEKIREKTPPGGYGRYGGYMPCW